MTLDFMTHSHSPRTWVDFFRISSPVVEPVTGLSHLLVEISFLILNSQTNARSFAVLYPSKSEAAKFEGQQFFTFKPNVNLKFKRDFIRVKISHLPCVSFTSFFN